MNELIIGALVEIGNTKAVKEECEPRVSQPLQLEKWMVKRTLMAWYLLEKKLDICI